jgi:2-dehydropantoate 2-reductase
MNSDFWHIPAARCGFDFKKDSELPNSMKKMKRVVLFGSGAMACLFAVRLAKAARIVMVDEWVESIDAIRQRGIRMEESHGVQTVQVDSHLLGEPIEPADLAVVLVKTWQTAKVASYLDACLCPDGLAVTLQNGIGNLEILGTRAFPGATAMGATLLGPGHARTGGEGLTQIVAPDWAVDLFRESGLETRRCDESEAESLLWGKLCTSCGINALTALLRITNGDLLEKPDASALMVRATEECAAVAHAKGIKLPFSDPASRVQEVAKQTAANKSSMLQDILRGAPTECDAINGAVAREGRRVAASTPVNDILWQLVRAASHQTGIRNADS